MNRRETTVFFEFQALDDDFFNDVAIERCKRLRDAHIVEIVLHVFALEIGEFIRNSVLFFPANRPIGEFLVVFCNFEPEVPTPRVNDEVKTVIVVFIDFDEVIPTAERSESIFGISAIEFPNASEFAQIDALMTTMRPFADVATARNIVANKAS